MFRVWNVVLIFLAFVLAQFGMFINRGGPVVSVHSFAASTLGYIFLGFMVLSALFCALIFIANYTFLGINVWGPKLRSRNIFDKYDVCTLLSI